MDVSPTNADYQAFLKLMTTQMKNQDPLAPLDATQFVTQLAQFSTVEQLVQNNGKLDALQSSVAALSSQGSVDLIGRSVEVAGDRLRLAEGEARFAVEVDGTPQALSYQVLDAEGQVVAGGDIAYAGARTPVVWDGRGSDGSALPDGAYRLRLQAVDGEGGSLAARGFVTEQVEQVVCRDGRTTLILRSGQEIEATSDMTVS